VIVLIFVTVATFGALACLLFAPDWFQEVLVPLFEKLAQLYLVTLQALERLLALITVFVHFLGKLATLVLLVVALTVFASESLAILGYESFLAGPDYIAWRDLFTKAYTWAAATTIVACTVAISNTRKHDLDSQDFVERQRERFSKRAAERQARLKT
jgi:hypothetical protein